MKCFYHNADFDGKCSAAIIKMKYPDCQFIGIDYGHVFPFEIINNKNETVFMVDFSLKINSLIQLSELCNLIWIDHHQTILKDADEFNFNPDGIRDNNYGACELVWKYIYPNSPVPVFVKYLSDYDIWKIYENILEFQYGLRLNNHSIDELSELIQKSIKNKKIINDIIDIGKIILKYEKSQNDIIQHLSFESELKFPYTGEKYKLICLNSSIKGSKKFESIVDLEKYDIMCSFNFNGEFYSISLYSNKDNIDCGSIAKRFGGGGHLKAAGFTYSYFPFSKN